MSPRSLPARFVARPNRFVVEATLDGDDARTVRAHLADPGRLAELLLPGAALRLRPAETPGRKTGYTVTLVREPGPSRAWVSVEASRANALAEPLLREGAVRGFGGAPRSLRREVRIGDSRFDFLLQTRRGDVVVEVKSVTLVEEGTGKFPDAPTERGRRHLQGLTRIAADGGRAGVLFVVQREDALRVAAHGRIDPAFADALAVARRGGVVLRAAAFAMGPDGSARYLGPLPVV